MAYEIYMFLLTAWMKVSIASSSLERKSPVDYTGDKILSISIDTDEKEQHVINLQKTYQDGVKYFGYDFPTRDEVTLHVNRHHADHIENKMKEGNLTYHVVCDDLGKLIRLERSGPRLRKFQRYGYNFGKHNDLAKIQTYLNQVTRKNRAHSQLSVIGKSFEKRKLYSVRIPRRKRTNKSAIVIECGMHAREWTSVEACIYLIQKFIEPDRNDAKVKTILSRYDITIIPVINPDGYDYTWKTDRMWRKTRSCAQKTCKGDCFGVDGNRNFDVGFCSDDKSSTDPCTDVYCGKKPFSEPETAALRNAVKKLGKRVLAFFSLHSYGPMWLTPYGTTRTFPKNYKELKRVADIGAAAIKKVNGVQFTVGPTSRVIYKASGTALDYFYDKGRAKYSYALELRPGKGPLKFILYEKGILPVCKETFEGLKAAILALRR